MFIPQDLRPVSKEKLTSKTELKSMEKKTMTRLLLDCDYSFILRFQFHCARMGKPVIQSNFRIKTTHVEVKQMVLIFFRVVLVQGWS